jgi:ribosomal protein S18 acetylase RimI-like enzyme
MEIELDGHLPEPQLPDGITIRALRPGEGEREVYRAVRDAFQDHFGYVERPFEEAFAEWNHFVEHDPDYDPSLRFIAQDGERIAGVSMCWPRIESDDDMGWVATLGVRREYRRTGIALALLHHSFRAFRERGKRRAGLGVDSESLTGATRLYEKAGMRVGREFALYDKTLHEGEDLRRQSLD